MGARIRAFDWVAHPLGPPEHWPQALRTAVRLMLTTQHPVLIMWGERLHCLYNDAFAATLGPEKHPSLLGERAGRAWKEASPTVGAEVERVLAGGGSVNREDQLVPIRRNGRLEEVYWTYSYSPIDHEGGVGGVFVLCTDTTARVVESRRRDAERDRQRRLFEQAPGFIIIMRGPEHVVEFVNDAHRAVFGSEGWEGKPIREAFPSIEGQGFFDRLDEVYRTGRTWEAHGVPVRYRRGPDAAEEARFLTFIYAPLHDEAGDVTGIFCEGFDVTQGKAAERRHALLAQLADLFRDVEDPDEIAYSAAEMLGRSLGVSRAGYGTIDTAAETIRIERDWNMPGVQSIAGTLHFRDYGSYIDDLKAGETVIVSNADEDPRTAPTSASLKAIAAHSFVNMPVTEQGGFVALLFLNHNEPREWPADELALIREVAERTRTAVARREAEQALKESEQRLRLAMESARIGTWDWDLVALKGAWSERTCEIMGVESGGEISVEQRYRSIHPEDREWVSAAVRRSIETGHDFSTEYRIVRPDGEVRWISSRGVVEMGPEGKAVRTVGTVRDVTARREAQEALQKLNRTLEQDVAERTAERDRMWRLSGDLFLVVGRHWNIRAVNPAVGPLLGYAPEEVLNRRFASFVHPDDLRAVAGIIRAAARGPVGDFMARLRAKDGSWRRFSWSAAPGEGEAYVIGRDVTAEMQRREALELAQEALRQSQKVEALGQLTGGVAHDFNNLLTPIVGNLDLLRRWPAAGAREQRLIGAALESAEKARTLVQRLLAFARRQPLQPGPVEVGGLIAGMAELIASTSGPLIRLQVDVADPLPAARADANQLEMAILNLSVNARDAMPDGGTLTLAAAPESIEPGHASKLPAGDYVRLSVSDTGIGMDEETAARAIEPFFSTKGIGKGTGLGLSMVHGLTSQLGGGMAIASRPGLGTTIHLYLPVSLAAVADDVAAPAAAAADAIGLVLLVDDEEAVRASTREMLETIGYRVIEAASAEAALSRAEGERIDFLVTDHLMPGMNGTDLARELTGRRPGLRALVVSGYAELEGLSPDVPRLSKPFRLDELAAAMTALGAPAAPSQPAASEG